MSRASKAIRISPPPLRNGKRLTGPAMCTTPSVAVPRTKAAASHAIDLGLKPPVGKQGAHERRIGMLYGPVHAQLGRLPAARVPELERAVRATLSVLERDLLRGCDPGASFATPLDLACHRDRAGCGGEHPRPFEVEGRRTQFDPAALVAPLNGCGQALEPRPHAAGRGSEVRDVGVDLEDRDRPGARPVQLEREPADLAPRGEAQPSVRGARCDGQRERPQIVETQRLALQLERMARDGPSVKLTLQPGGRSRPRLHLPHGAQVAQHRMPNRRRDRAARSVRRGARTWPPVAT